MVSQQLGLYTVLIVFLFKIAFLLTEVAARSWLRSKGRSLLRRYEQIQSLILVGASEPLLELGKLLDAIASACFDGDHPIQEVCFSDSLL
jgi:hypothetical protein